MSLVVLGLSHHGAPIDLLEVAVLDAQQRHNLATSLLATGEVREVVILSTCNRTEIYADAVTFHGAVAELTAALAQVTGVDRALLQPHLFVHYADRGVAHAFTVAAGLDSMAVGERQIVGQVRRAFAEAQDAGHVNASLNSLFQQGLRVAKRVHSETEIELVAGSLVQAGLARAEAVLGPLAHSSVLVIGAGGMGALAASHVQRAGAASLAVANRDRTRAESVAARFGGTSCSLSELPTALTDADIVISSTGARGLVVTADLARRSMEQRGGTPQVYIDLALPHDIDYEVTSIEGVTRVGLGDLGVDLDQAEASPAVTHARDIVTEEVAAFTLARAADNVAPTVTALRARAAEVVNDEIARLSRRAPGLNEAEQAEVRRTVERVVDKLLHAPTVRVKQLVSEGHGDYARALSDLFDLDPRDIALVSSPPVVPGEES